jgi:hypothetical protein
LQAWTIEIQVQATLGAAGGVITGGYGAWQSVAIPRGDPLTQWTGRTALTMDLDLLFDGYSTQTSVDPQIQTLEQLATRPPGMLTPPSLRIYGAVPHANAQWVISDITWNECIRSSTYGSRLRQACMVHLMEYRPGETLTAVNKGIAATLPPVKYTVQAGDNLKKIAAHKLLHSARWKEIVDANKDKHLTGTKLPPNFEGKVLQIPASVPKKKRAPLPPGNNVYLPPSPIQWN